MKSLVLVPGGVMSVTELLLPYYFKDLVISLILYVHDDIYPSLVVKNEHSNWSPSFYPYGFTYIGLLNTLF